MRLINIVDNVSQLNYGLWNSVIINNNQLERAAITSALWFPGSTFSFSDNSVIPVALDSINIKELHRQIVLQKLNPATDIIVTHGLWNYPTKWGNKLKHLGFKWIYVPHGMLEPWPLQQKWLKKKIYFNLIERNLAREADIIRAVSQPEARNLKTKFPGQRIEFIPNGVAVGTLNQRQSERKSSEFKRYLFLSRLHHKKNIIALAQAWQESALSHNMSNELVIAGPDQGELEKLRGIIATSKNIKYVGGVFGSDKEGLLNSSTFYVLPSFSEGLPSALLEAMAHGLIPIITEGCNFPDVFENDLGVIVTTEKISIKEALEKTAGWDSSTIKDKSDRGRALIEEEYSLEAITKKQIEIYFGPEYSS